MGLLQRRYTNAPSGMFSMSPVSIAGWNGPSFCGRGLYDQRRWCETQTSLEPLDKQLSRIQQLQICKSSAAVAECALPYIPSMGMHDLCAVLAVLKRFRTEPQPELMKAVADQIIQQKSTLQPRHISHIFHICARLRWVNSDLFEAMAQQTMLPFQVSSPSRRRRT